MNFGLMDPFRNGPGCELPFSELYRTHLELAVEAEAMGYDTFWFTEHHFVPDGYSPDVLGLAGALAARTSRIRIGTHVVLMPLHHPLRVAEAAATVDVLSNGRLDLGLGQGYRPQEFVGYAVSRRERSARLHEGVEIIRRLFVEEDVTYAGRFHQIKEATLYPRPVQQPHPRLWLAARSRQATEHVARAGLNLLGSGNLGVYGDTRQSEVYRQALAAAGHATGDFCISQVRYGHVAETRAKAWDEAERPLHYMAQSFGQWLADANDVPGDENFRKVPSPAELRRLSEGDLSPDAPLVGSPDDIVGILEPYFARERLTHLVLELALPGLSPAQLRNSMQLFARQVIPRLRRV